MESSKPAHSTLDQDRSATRRTFKRYQRSAATPVSCHPRRRPPTSSFTLGSSSPLRGLATVLLHMERAVMSGPHRPCEGWQLGGEVDLWCGCGRPHRPCEGWQRVHTASRAARLGRGPHRPCEGWQHREPASGDRDGFSPHRPCEGWQRETGSVVSSPGRSSSPLRGLATRCGRVRCRGRTKSSSPLRGLATRAATCTRPSPCWSSSPLRGLATRRSGSRRGQR